MSGTPIVGIAQNLGPPVSVFGFGFHDSSCLLPSRKMTMTPPRPCRLLSRRRGWRSPPGSVLRPSRSATSEVTPWARDGGDRRFAASCNYVGSIVASLANLVVERMAELDRSRSHLPKGGC